MRDKENKTMKTILLNRFPNIRNQLHLFSPWVPWLNEDQNDNQGL